MPKIVGSPLQTSIEKAVTTIATCIKITRRDGKPYYLTAHDEDVVFEGQTYRHDIPFIVGAVDSGSQLAIDNTELTLFADDTTFSRVAFEAGVFDHAECEVFHIDYENPTYGALKLRRGWFGKIQTNRQNQIKITVNGMLKVLDFETGRIYQPTCDADLGDSRCKVAIRQEQLRSPFNEYRVGDWVFDYDTSLMTEIPLTNGDFEAGAKSEAQDIPGWTKSEGSAFFVADTATSPTVGFIDALDAGEGTYSLYGSQDATPGDSGAEQYVYQDVDLISAGLSAGAIDDGQISLGLFSLVGQTVYTDDPIQLRIDLLDESGDFVGSFPSRWIHLDVFNYWRERAVVCPVYPGARTARVYLMMKKEDGITFNGAFDNARLFWWNHLTQTPYDGVIHRLTRIIDFDNLAYHSPVNFSFEANSFVANANNPTITGWTVSGWWQVDNDKGDPGQNLVTVPGGSLFLAGGDDSSGIQRTNTVTQSIELASVTGLNLTRVALGKMVCKFKCWVGFAGAGESTATVKLEMQNSTGTTLQSITLLNDANYGGVHAWDDLVGYSIVPAATSKVLITLSCTSPVGDSDAKVGFDEPQIAFADMERPVRTDPTFGYTDETVTLETEIGGFTVDDTLIWKALGTFTQYDQVSEVTDRKSFKAVTMTGSDGTYETGTIWWISGQNAGLRNVIRTWDSDTRAVKMYFRMPYPIGVGDRFIYVRSCQRRFSEDCQLVFENQINFRGFPKLPGKLRDATDAENAAG